MQCGLTAVEAKHFSQSRPSSIVYFRISGYCCSLLWGNLKLLRERKAWIIPPLLRKEYIRSRVFYNYYDIQIVRFWNGGEKVATYACYCHHTNFRRNDRLVFLSFFFFSIIPLQFLSVFDLHTSMNIFLGGVGLLRCPIVSTVESSSSNSYNIQLEKEPPHRTDMRVYLCIF